jgi:hypothetical protein
MLLSGVLLGIVAGAIISRGWRRLAALEIRWLPVLVVALGARAVASFIPNGSLALYIVGMGLVALAGLINWRVPGALFVMIGSVLNLVVTLANGGMPVDSNALSAAGGGMPEDGLHRPLDDQTRLGGLADIVPLASFRSVYSIGDFVVALGGFLAPFVTLTRR